MISTTKKTRQKAGLSLVCLNLTTCYALVFVIVAMLIME
ncbi:hypothetical protein Agau_C201655 [Agrobacterium tumefaciens F2]|nr:hypothetical protein Agau_C201655 [Agrobacterium tumefaciens F2]